MTETQLLDDVRAAIASESRLGPGQPSIDVEQRPDGTLALTGEVDRVAKKRLAASHARRIAGSGRVVDEIRVTPAEPRPDSKIRDAAMRTFEQEAAFNRLTMGIAGPHDYAVIADPPESLGRIDIGVADGVVTLDGRVPGLDYKRLAGVLAWWIPGSTAVVDRLRVEPPEDDTEAGLTDAIRVALEKDPFVDASQIRVVNRDRKVLLEGWTKTDTEKDIAEADAWYVFGVEDVVNRIETGY